jgi:predicted enzyme related to lactoylglutathione lyase
MSENIGKIGWIDKGGKVVVEPRGLAGGRFCVIEDPNGATAALYQP